MRERWHRHVIPRHQHPEDGMRQLNGKVRIAQGLVAAAGLVLGIGLAGPAGVAAKGEPDHLQCYEVRDSHPAVSQVVKLLNRQFDASECKVSLRSALLCAPTAKFSRGSPDGDDPRGEALETDFLCYRVSCRPPNDAAAVVSDQFGERKIRVGAARMICTPTKKELIP
jgi:hypothetical protein